MNLINELLAILWTKFMKKEIDLTKKKPKLAYVGMDEKTLVEAVPTQVVEVVYPLKAEKKDENTLFAKGELQQKITKSEDFPKNRLIWTNDNLVALKTLLDEKDAVSGEYKYRNKINLIYIDPPFMVQDDFVAKNTIDINVDKEEGVVSVKEPTIIETIVYKDTWQNGLDSFLHMMRERLELMKELLSPTGSIYVHLDWHTVHYVKVLMDEIFDYSLFRNEIVWHYYNKYSKASKVIPRAHDTILFYSKTEENYLNEVRELREKPVKQLVRENIDGVLKNARDEHGNLIYREAIDKKVDDVWRIPALQYASEEWTGFPTQKHPELLKRIIQASCPTNGIILDAFLGSGTTVVEAEKLFNEINCTWIGIDNSKFGIHTARKRLIELNEKSKGKKGEGIYKVRPFTVENMGYYQHLAFFAPLTVKINKVVDGKETMIELAGVEVDIESFLESQKPDRREELKKWLEQEKSWQSFVDFWAIDWDYDDLKDDLKEPVFENEWQSFRKRKGKKVVEDLVFKAFHKYEKPGEYIIAIKVTDVFGNDGIKSFKVVIK